MYSKHTGRMNKRNIQAIQYFFIHFFLEVVSFYVVTSYIRHDMIWMLALLYDFFAFVPQGIFGYFKDRGQKLNLAALGSLMTLLSLTLMMLKCSPAVIILILAAGNCMIHIQGAETTLHGTGGRITPSAVFVSGGSFGVVTGKLLSGMVPIPFIMAVNAVMILLILCTAILDRDNPAEEKTVFKFVKDDLKAGKVIVLATIVVAVRSFMGFVVPTGWQETAMHTVFLYSSMGIGKAAGGILVDRIGARKTSLISTLGALPFLLLGNTIMGVSLIGIMLFSMTMAITLGLIVSAIRDYPGVAFGYTTIGLFLGVLPVFFVSFGSVYIKCILLAVLTVICIPVLLGLTEKPNSKKIISEGDNV